MLALEEHVSGYKDITQHKRFSGAGRHRFLPKVNTCLASLQQQDQQLVVVDVLRQYDRPIGIPPTQQHKGLRVVSVAGFESHQRVKGAIADRHNVTHASDACDHVQQMAFHAERARHMINRMFG
jgi:hypothetical protein